MSIITVTEFEERLGLLCSRKGGQGLPKKQRDQQILFKSIILLFDPERSYTETEVNQVLEKWLAEVGQTVEIDRVSLRRHLIDEGYLRRDSAGALYQVATKEDPPFAPEIEELDPAVIVEMAKARQEQRKQAYLSGTEQV